MAWLALAMALPFAPAQAQTFLPVPLNLSNTGHAVIPSIAVGPTGEIDVAWLDAGAILFRRSVDGGQTFSSTITVATTNLPSQGAQASQTAQPQIAVNSGGVYVAWAGVNAAGGGDIFFSSVASGGTSWLSLPVNVSNGSGMAAGSGAPVPHVTVDPSGGVDIVWGQNGAYFARSANGTSFSGAVQLTASAMASESPRMAIDPRGYIYAVWANADPNCPSMTFARSINLGGTFQTYPVSDALTVGGSQETGCASKVQIALGASNTIHLLWANDTPIQDLVTTYQADPGGSSFAGFGESAEQGFQNLSSTSSFTPQIAIDASGNINVVWIGDYQQNGGPPAVYFSRSTGGGANGSFSNQQALTAPPVSGLPTGFPQIVTEPSGAIDVIWQQASAANPSAAYDVVLARSTAGATFQKFTMDSAPTSTANTGQIAVDSKGNGYVLWLGSAGSGGDVLINGDSQGITTPPPFNLAQVNATVSPVSATISVGGATSFAVSLQSTNPVPGSVTLACGGAPAGVSCTFTPGSVSLSANGSGATTLNVSVSVMPAATAALPRPAGRVGAGPQGMTDARAARMWAIGFMVFVMLLIAARHEDSRLGRYARGLAWSLVLAAAVTAMVSCGGSTSSSGGGGGSVSGGSGGGGGGNSVTFPLVVQGQANSSSTNLQTISITVP
jgi:hypothetical protein